MTIEEILEQWSKDSKINLTQLDVESAGIPILHHRYYSMFVPERLKFKKMTNEFKKLKLLKWEYYSGNMSEPECKEYGWEQFERKLVKTDIDKYMDADKDIIEQNLKVALQEEKVDLLDSILKSFTGRGFNLRVAMDFLKFQNGQ